MWTMTKYGFFSAVCAREGDGSPGQRVDPDKVMVRARDVAHLENLIERFPNWLNAHTIHESDESDYPCRIFMQKSIWQCIVNDIIKEMDYDNFKSEVHRSELTDPRYGDALMSTWGTMHRVTPPSTGDDLPLFRDTYTSWTTSGTSNHASHWFDYTVNEPWEPGSDSDSPS
jgi:hypothetical protein